MFLHECLGEVFAALEPCPRSIRAHNFYFFELFIGFEKIYDSFYQRVFRTHNYQTNTL